MCQQVTYNEETHMKVDTHAHTRSQFLRIQLAIREAEMTVVKWGRKRGNWHFVNSAELKVKGERRRVSVCGEWAGLLNVHLHTRDCVQICMRVLIVHWNLVGTACAYQEKKKIQQKQFLFVWRLRICLRLPMFKLHRHVCICGCSASPDLRGSDKL